MMVPDRLIPNRASASLSLASARLTRRAAVNNKSELTGRCLQIGSERNRKIGGQFSKRGHLLARNAQPRQFSHHHDERVAVNTGELFEGSRETDKLVAILDGELADAAQRHVQLGQAALRGQRLLAETAQRASAEIYSRQ